MNTEHFNLEMLQKTQKGLNAVKYTFSSTNALLYGEYPWASGVCDVLRPLVQITASFWHHSDLEH